MLFHSKSEISADPTDCTWHSTDVSVGEAPSCSAKPALAAVSAPSLRWRSLWPSSDRLWPSQQATVLARREGNSTVRGPASFAGDGGTVNASQNGFSDKAVSCAATKACCCNSGSTLAGAAVGLLPSSTRIDMATGAALGNWLGQNATATTENRPITSGTA